MEPLSYEQCAICDKNASGIHFNIKSCRSCPGFFKRSVLMGKSYRCRRNTYDCFNNKEQLRKCKFCRYKRCVDLGMSLKGSSRMFKTKMIAPPYDEILGKQSECSDLESSSDRAVIKEASLSTSDYQKIVKLIVDQVKATFASKFTSPEMFSEVPLNHLQRANMAIDLYIQRREIRPVGEILINAKVEFMEQMQFRKKAFIQNTDILMFFSDFAKLECGEKMFLFRHFWPQFSTFANAIVSMQVFARYPDKFYYIVSENKAIDTCSDVCTNLSYLQGYAPEAIELLKKPLAFLIDKIFNPIKQLNLDRTECAYITLQILWSQKKKPGLSAATEEMMDRLLREINTEMHHYYVYEKKISDYVFRMSEMMKLIMVCFKHCQNLRETVMAAKTFNLFESLYNESEVSSLVGVV